MSEQLLRTAQDSIDFLRRALIHKNLKADIEVLRAANAQMAAEIEWLTEQLRLANIDAFNESAENTRLRAALENAEEPLAVPPRPVPSEKEGQ